MIATLIHGSKTERWLLSLALIVGIPFIIRDIKKKKRLQD